MEYQTILVEKKDRVAVVTLNRPKALNSLSRQVARDLFQCAQILEADPEVWVTVLTGSGRAFAAGADIKEVREFTPIQMRDWTRELFTSLERFGGMDMPVIAAVNGLALGGGFELALACDLIYASDKAQFGVPEIKIGVFPGAGGVQKLSRLIGLPRAKEMVYFGDFISAEIAQQYGAANEVFPHDQFMEKVMEKASALAQMSPVALKVTKALFREGFHASPTESVYRDIDANALLFSTEDQKEGMNAFVEKRKALFKGA
ncbi:enoyl-CoA hydratase/isomerase family protein [Thermodesulfobacteriota bacterium]